MRRANALSSLVFGLAAGLSLAPIGTAAAQSEPSHATDDEARALFDAGRIAYTDGRFDDALGYFQRAYALSQRAALLYNVAQTFDRLSRNREALEAYRGYLAAEHETPQRSQIEARIRVLEELIAAEDARDAEAARLRSELDAERARAAAAQGSPTNGATAASRADAPLGPIVLFGVAGAGLLTGVTFGALALDRQGALASCGPEHVCDPSLAGTISDLSTFALVSDVAFGVSLASAAAATIWWLVDGSSSEASAAPRAMVVPWASPTGGGLQLTFID